jgi:hypothetical protein
VGQAGNRIPVARLEKAPLDRIVANVSSAAFKPKCETVSYLNSFAAENHTRGARLEKTPQPRGVHSTTIRNEGSPLILR